MDGADHDLLRAVISATPGTEHRPRASLPRGFGARPVRAPPAMTRGAGKGDERQPGLTCEGPPKFYQGSGTLTLPHIPCTCPASVNNMRGVGCQDTQAPGAVTSITVSCTRVGIQQSPPLSSLPLPPAHSSNHIANTRKAHEERNSATFVVLPLPRPEIRVWVCFFFFFDTLFGGE